MFVDHNQIEKMWHAHASRRWTQTAHKNKADDSFQYICCKTSEGVKFLHSILAVAAVAVSFGTWASLCYRAKQEEE